MTIQRSELIKELAASTEGVTQKTVTAVLNALEDMIPEIMSRGDSVKIFKSVTFEPVWRSEKVMTNNFTGGEITLPACYVPKARFSQSFKDKVNVNA